MKKSEGRSSRLLNDHLGLNFTAATLLSACKYIGCSTEVGKNGWHEFSKIGYFSSERAVVSAARNAMGIGTFKHPIAFIVEAADDIAYCTSDIEDGVRKRMLYWPMIEELMSASGGGDKFSERILDTIRKYLSNEQSQKPAYNEAMGHAFRIFAVSELIGAAVRCFALRYDEIMEGSYHDELMSDTECEAVNFIRTCRDILKQHLYVHADVLKIEIFGRKIISDLLCLIWDAIAADEPQDKTGKTYSGKIYNILSDNYRCTFEQRLAAGENETYCKLQLAIDQVAGMTDTFASRLHHSLFA